MPHRPLLLLCCCLITTHAASQNFIDLGFNGDAVRGAYGYHQELRGLSLDGGVLHNRDTGTLFHVGALAVGEAASRTDRLRAGLGARLAYADGSGADRSGLLLAPGGMVSWVLPRADRVTLSAEVYFAPDVLAGGDLESFTDASIRATFNVSERAAAYVGGRYVRGEFDESRSTIFDNGVHIGLRLGF